MFYKMYEHKHFDYSLSSIHFALLLEYMKSSYGEKLLVNFNEYSQKLMWVHFWFAKPHSMYGVLEKYMYIELKLLHHILTCKTMEKTWNSQPLNDPGGNNTAERLDFKISKSKYCYCIRGNISAQNACILFQMWCNTHTFIFLKRIKIIIESRPH